MCFDRDFAGVHALLHEDRPGSGAAESSPLRAQGAAAVFVHLAFAPPLLSLTNLHAMAIFVKRSIC